MALGNKKSNADAGKTPEFENEAGDTAVADKPDASAKAPAQAPAAAPVADTASAGASEDVSQEATKATSTAIAKASNTSLSVQDAANQAKAFQKELDAMHGASDFSFGNYRQFKASNGEIMESGGDEDSLGRWAKVRLLSWDTHFEVSPGEQGASTKDFVAYSKDGKIIDSVIGEEQKSWAGKPVDEYLAYLKDEDDGEGFENAKCREFIDTACALIATDNGDGPIGEVIQITLAESSMSAFTKYQQGLKDRARCVSMGLPGFKMPEDPFTFFFLREAAQKGNNKWTKLKIVSDLPAKL